MNRLWHYITAIASIPIFSISYLIGFITANIRSGYLQGFRSNK